MGHGRRRRAAVAAEVATKMPASAAYMKAISTGSRKFVCEPLISR